eukprot:c17935_g1_i1.p1 GENE.c17935_g1_i1~~c17935_g1_i1.p1  ORF type:complete len:619 (+),score=215.92 c17935_g1_i1:799-2655(+)
MLKKRLLASLNPEVSTSGPNPSFSPPQNLKPQPTQPTQQSPTQSQSQSQTQSPSQQFQQSQSQQYHHHSLLPQAQKHYNSLHSKKEFDNNHHHHHEVRGKEQKFSRKPEFNEKGEQLYCICRKPYNPRAFMIGCDRCDDWFHGKCVKLTALAARSLERYVCPLCEKKIQEAAQHHSKSHLEVKNDENSHEHPIKKAKLHHQPSAEVVKPKPEVERSPQTPTRPPQTEGTENGSSFHDSNFRLPSSERVDNENDSSGSSPSAISSPKTAEETTCVAEVRSPLRTTETAPEINSSACLEDNSNKNMKEENPTQFKSNQPTLSYIESNSITTVKPSPSPTHNNTSTNNTIANNTSTNNTGENTNNPTATKSPVTTAVSEKPQSVSPSSVLFSQQTTAALTTAAITTATSSTTVTTPTLTPTPNVAEPSTPTPEKTCANTECSAPSKNKFCSDTCAIAVAKDQLRRRKDLLSSPNLRNSNSQFPRSHSLSSISPLLSPTPARSLDGSCDFQTLKKLQEQEEEIQKSIEQIDLKHKILTDAIQQAQASSMVEEEKICGCPLIDGPNKFCTEKEAKCFPHQHWKSLRLAEVAQERGCLEKKIKGVRIELNLIRSHSKQPEITTT